MSCVVLQGKFGSETGTNSRNFGFRSSPSDVLGREIRWMVPSGGRRGQPGDPRPEDPGLRWVPGLGLSTPISAGSAPSPQIATTCLLESGNLGCGCGTQVVRQWASGDGCWHSDSASEYNLGCWSAPSGFWGTETRLFDFWKKNLGSESEQKNILTVA